MNTWLNKYCPGFMVVPRKPHPYGNEYHSITDGDKGTPSCGKSSCRRAMTDRRKLTALQHSPPSMTATPRPLTSKMPKMSFAYLHI
jgi:hypothetical protein